jgi:hypothetical protein
MISIWAIGGPAESWTVNYTCDPIAGQTLLGYQVFTPDGQTLCDAGVVIVPPFATAGQITLVPGPTYNVAGSYVVKLFRNVNISGGPGPNPPETTQASFVLEKPISSTLSNV